MPSTVEVLFHAANLEPAGPVRWRQAVSETRSGAYAIALTDRVDRVAGTLPTCPLDNRVLSNLLAVRPELLLDARRPTVSELGWRLGGFWLADETVLYLGRSKGLAARLRQFYRHRLGASKPHEGGWPLKTLAVLDELWIHWAPTAGYVAAEQAMLEAFAADVSANASAALYRAEPLLPFANLEDANTPRRRKLHGITRTGGPMPARA